MTVETDARPTLAEVVEFIGIGPAQLKISLLAGSVWLADGAEILLIGSVTGSVAKEWPLQRWQRGLIVSVVFIGILLGNCLSGPLGDRRGRRLPVIISYAGIAVFSTLSACAPNLLTLCCLRLLVGASFGIGQPAASTLCCEITPIHWRIAVTSLTSALFTVGEIFSCLLIWLDDPQMQNLQWRRLLVLGTIPSVVFCVLACNFLPQSPFYLAVNGDFVAARSVLESMKADNRAWDANVDFRPPHHVDHKRSTLEPFAVLFSSTMIYSTMVIIYSCFTLNVVYYGCLYAFPQVITQVELGNSPAMVLLVGALWELPGLVLAVACCVWWPRKPVVIGYLISSTLSLLLFGYGITAAGNGLVREFATQGGYFGIKAFVTVGFVAVYQYSMEIYPTVARTTGTAVCIAGGRLGGIIAPLVFEWTLQRAGRAGVFFFAMSLLCIMNAVLVLFLPFETFGKALEDHLDEAAPLMTKPA